MIARRQLEAPAEIHPPHAPTLRERLDSTADVAAVRFFGLLRHMFASEPTLWIETGAAFALLAYGVTFAWPGSRFEQFPDAYRVVSRFPEWLWALVTIGAAINQAFWILRDGHLARGRSSLLSGLVLAFLG